MRPWQSVIPAAMGSPAPSLPRSNGKNPATSGPSLRTATRAPGRNSPTAIVNSGERNGLARDGVLDCMARQEAMSSGPNSAGRTTETRISSLLFPGRPADQAVLVSAGVGQHGPVLERAGHPRAVIDVPGYRRVAVRAAEIDVPADSLTWRRLLPPLEQQPDRHPGARRPAQVGEPRHRRGLWRLAGERGPEGALAGEQLRRDVQAQRVHPADPAAIHRPRGRHGTLPLPADQAERDPAGTIGDDHLARLPVPHGGAKRHRQVGRLIECLQRPARRIDVQVEVVTAVPGKHPLHPQIGVPRRRQQAGEIAAWPAERRQAVARHRPPERDARAEPRRGEIQEDREPPERHALKVVCCAMRTVEPEVFLVARPQIDYEAIAAYLREVGGERWLERLDRDQLDTDAQNLAEFAGRMCYRSWEPGLNPNVSRIREDQVQYLQNILRSGHGSVLEHINFTFVLHNVSRVFTHEAIRHRAGTAISQESLRFVRLDELPFWFPDWAQQDPELMKRATALLTEMEAFQQWMAGHFRLDDDGVPFHEKKHKTSFMRRFAPDGVATGLVWTANIRALRHTIEMRTDAGAEEEIRLVFGKIAEIMRAEAPALFGDYQVTDGAWVPGWRKV